MYRVVVITDGKEYPLHEPRDNEGALQLIDPVVIQDMGNNGQLTFRIAPGHPYRDQIHPLKSEIIAYQDDEIIFAGRSVGNESDFYNLGKVTCEGEQAYLIDSIQRPYEFTGSVTEFVRQCLNVHNSQVDPWKRFELGNVTVPDAAAEIVRSNKDCANTLKTLKSQLVKRNGGYLRVRRANGKKYLDYVSDYGGLNSQVIRFGENLLDLSRYVKPISIITALIPYGATIESDNTEEEDKPLDITSVNNGIDYIYDQTAVDTYGWIYGVQTFDDVTDPAALLAKGKAYLQEAAALPVTLDLKAVDMSLIDVDIHMLRIGCWTQVESVPHGISKRFLLTKKSIHLDNPGKDEIILGETLPTLTGSANKEQAAITERINRIADSTSREINRKVENATQLITGGKGGYVVLDVYDPDTGEKTHPWRILVMDTPDKDTAKCLWQLNKNGLGFSRTGINGPYDNAWTIDGNLVADFITAGTMLADRIRGGILEVGGAGLARDGSITVKDSNGNVIGKWDKTGLHVYLGVIQGSEINASDINGSNIYGGNITGTTIDVGVFAADDNRAGIGNFYVSDLNGRNVLQSRDGSVMLSEDASGVSTLFCVGGNEFDSVLRASAATRLVYAQDIYLYSTGYNTFWTVGECIKNLYEEIDNLKNMIG